MSQQSNIFPFRRGGKIPSGLNCEPALVTNLPAVVEKQRQSVSVGILVTERISFEPKKHWWHRESPLRVQYHMVVEVREIKGGDVITHCMRYVYENVWDVRAQIVHEKLHVHGSGRSEVRYVPAHIEHLFKPTSW